MLSFLFFFHAGFNLQFWRVSAPSSAIAALSRFLASVRARRTGAIAASSKDHPTYTGIRPDSVCGCFLIRSLYVFQLEQPDYGYVWINEWINESDSLALPWINEWMNDEPMHVFQLQRLMNEWMNKRRQRVKTENYGFHKKIIIKP